MLLNLSAYCRDYNFSMPRQDLFSLKTQLNKHVLSKIKFLSGTPYQQPVIKKSLIALGSKHYIVNDFQKPTVQSERAKDLKVLLKQVVRLDSHYVLVTVKKDLLFRDRFYICLYCPHNKRLFKSTVTMCQLQSMPFYFLDSLF